MASAEKIIKRFTFDEVVKHYKWKGYQSNLLEKLSRFPNKGIGFNVWQKDWEGPDKNEQSKATYIKIYKSVHFVRYTFPY
jgi:hypothetical protein